MIYLFLTFCWQSDITNNSLYAITYVKKQIFSTSRARQSKVVNQHISSKTKDYLILYIETDINVTDMMSILCRFIVSTWHHRSPLTPIETILKPFVLNYLIKLNNENEAFCELIFKLTFIRFYQYFFAIRYICKFNFRS